MVARIKIRPLGRRPPIRYLELNLPLRPSSPPSDTPGLGMVLLPDSNINMPSSLSHVAQHQVHRVRSSVHPGWFILIPDLQTTTPVGDTIPVRPNDITRCLECKISRQHPSVADGGLRSAVRPRPRLISYWSISSAKSKLLLTVALTTKTRQRSQIRLS